MTDQKYCHEDDSICILLLHLGKLQISRTEKNADNLFSPSHDNFITKKNCFARKRRNETTMNILKGKGNPDIIVGLMVLL